MKQSLLFLLLVFLPSCSNTMHEKNNQQSQAEIYDLNESTNIILSLIKKEELPLILAESENDADKVDTLLKNFSPSEIAFEAEVLNQENPVVLLYYDPLNNNDQIIELFTEFAKKYHDSLKFVKIDKDKLFKITERSEVDVFPTLVVINNRQEIARFERPALNLLEAELQKFI